MGKHALEHVQGFIKRNDEYIVDPRVLVIEEGFNIRESYGDEEDLVLKENIRENGVETALKVQKTADNKLIIREGHRRHWACMELIKEGVDIKGVPIKLIDKNTSPGNALFTTMICSTGKRFKPFEEAKGFNRLIKFGFSVSEIAKRCGISTVTVYDRLKLVNASAETRQAVEKGEVSIHTAAKAVSTSGGDEAKQKKAIANARIKPSKIIVKFDKRKKAQVIKGADEDQMIQLAKCFDDEFAASLADIGLDPDSFVFSIQAQR